MADWSAVGARHVHEILAAAGIFATGLFAGSLLAAPPQSSSVHRPPLDASDTEAVRKIIDRLEKATGSP